MSAVHDENRETTARRSTGEGWGTCEKCEASLFTWKIEKHSRHRYWNIKEEISHVRGEPVLVVKLAILVSIILDNNKGDKSVKNRF